MHVVFLFQSKDDTSVHEGQASETCSSVCNQHTLQSSDSNSNPETEPVLQCNSFAAKINSSSSCGDNNHCDVSKDASRDANEIKSQTQVRGDNSVNSSEQFVCTVDRQLSTMQFVEPGKDSLELSDDVKTIQNKNAKLHPVLSDDEDFRVTRL